MADSTTSKKVILFSGIALYIFTCMSKVLVPGTIHGELEAAFGLNANELAALGAALMYSYAASQFALGLFADRYGGCRLVLFGAVIFAIGSVVSTIAPCYLVLLAARVFVGFGAGVCYVGVAKLAAELYSSRFLLAITTIILVGCLGQMAGNGPMAYISEATSWRTMLALTGVFSVIALLAIALFSRGALPPVIKGGRTMSPAGLFCKKSNLTLFLAASTVIGAHFTLCSLIGKRCLQDTGLFTSVESAWWMSLIMIIVTASNVAGIILLKLFRGSRKKLLVFASAASTVGCAIGVLYFSCSVPWQMLIAGFILISATSGLYPAFSTIAKELNPPENVGMALAMLNFLCYAAVAVEQNVAGAIFRHFEKIAPLAGGAYSATAYQYAFVALAVFSLAGLFAALMLPEKRGEN
ncbi:MAG: MFS transporter [Victivallaceae bacterium]|nr:MFS transporter [Victivallaceae bacterium]